VTHNRKVKVLQNQHQNFLDTILNWSQKKLKKDSEDKEIKEGELPAGLKKIP
jgi:hypothetical protein